MTKRSGWITPFKKQCFVTVGASLNLAAHGLTVGFGAMLLPQLKRPDSIIPVDESSGSWVGGILGFALIAGNFTVPSLMSRLGRRPTNIISILFMIVGWFGVITSTNITMLLISRVLQGISMGISSSLGPVLIGEYTSPKNRGAFLTTMSLFIACGNLTVHSLGAYLHWQKTALICACIAFADLLIVLFSPETPSWLADQGRYDECKKMFRWLRGDDEEDELKAMIENSMIIRESREEANVATSFVKTLKSNLAYCNETIRKKEFYKPIFIMCHIYTLGQWGGANLMSAYAVDVFENIVGKDANIAILVITLDIQRIISNASAMYMIKKVKRRTMLFTTVGINLFAFLSIALYTYGKAHGVLPFDHQMIGVFLIHIHMLSIATGMVPLPLIIAGELFPLEYRGLAGAISVFFLAGNLFITVKTAPLLFISIGVYGTYLLSACVVAYCLTIATIFLPETKDRTLQDIEDEFRGRPLSPAELKSMQSLTSLSAHNRDRRCSSPII